MEAVFSPFIVLLISETSRICVFK
ncbi:unnamed protein product [Ilex paraguariensis]|uniref:Uncharacterized protein n=1 Tax=Ilex paraguariensis TaxID=185542 RepID=A0ABC8RIA0_9AQUA